MDFIHERLAVTMEWVWPYLQLTGTLISFISNHVMRLNFVLVIITIVYILLVCIYYLFLHPLAHVPGPRSAAVSNIWLAFRTRAGDTFHLSCTLHKKYGPIVRVGPNELWFSSSEALRAIYATSPPPHPAFTTALGPTGPLNKGEFFLASALQQPERDWQGRIKKGAEKDSLDLLSERDGVRYRRQRRMLGGTYAAGAMKRFRPVVRGIVEKAVVRIDNLMNGWKRKVEKAQWKGQVVGADRTKAWTGDGDPRRMIDLREWMHIVAVEALGAVVLSWSPGLLRNGTDWQTGEHGYMTWRRRSVLGLFPAAVKMGQVSKALNRLFGRAWGITYLTPKGFRPFFPAVYRQVKKRINLLVPSISNPVPNGDSRRDLLYDLIQLHLNRPEFTDEYLRRMAVTNFGAGHETLAATLTAALALIGLDNRVQEKLHEELALDETSEDTLSVDGPDAAEKKGGYTYLQSCIKESQRLFPVISMSMVRVVGSKGLTVGSLHIPPGTNVGISPTALHRDMDIVGPDAYSYIPERWLTPTRTSSGTYTLSSGLQVDPYSINEDFDAMKRRVSELERTSLAWGAAGRTCPGRNLAEVIITEIVTGFVKEFQVEIDQTREDLERGVKAYYICVLFGIGVHFRRRRGARG